MNIEKVQQLADTPRNSIDMSNEKLVNETRGEYLKAIEFLSDTIDVCDKKGKTEESLKHQVNFEKLINKIERIDHEAPKNGVKLHEATSESYSWPDTKNGVGGGKAKNIEIWESVSGKNKGSEIKVLNNRALMAEVYGNKNLGEQGPTWNEYLRSRIAGHTGDNSIMGAKNFMSTSSDSALVPEPLSMSVIDLARNKSRIFQAGAQVFNMTSKTETIARVTGDPSAQWKAENASHSSSDVGTEPLTFTAKTLIASVKMSVELSEDAPNGSNIIENSLSQQLALELDRAALVGDGTGASPQGVFGYTGVQTQALNAALSNYDPFSLAYEKVLQANGEPTGIIYAPRTWGQLDRLKDANNQPLTPPSSYSELAKYQTNQVPINLGTGEDESLAFLANWAQLMVGVRTNLRLEVTRVASDSTNSAFEDLQVWVRAYMRADIQLAQPTHFCVIEGIQNPA